jgi:hypothetical protein
MKVRISKREYSSYIESDTDIVLAAEMAVKVAKSNPMVVGEPIAEISPGCPMGYAKPKVILNYDIINPSAFDKFKMFVTKKSLNDIVKEIKGAV